jgi:hypothetical protein
MPLTLRNTWAEHERVPVYKDVPDYSVMSSEFVVGLPRQRWPSLSALRLGKITALRHAGGKSIIVGLRFCLAAASQRVDFL